MAAGYKPNLFLYKFASRAPWPVGLFLAVPAMLSSTDVVERVKETLSTPYRPDVNGQGVSRDITELMTSCWDEDPDNRPAFRFIRNDFKELNKGR